MMLLQFLIEGVAAAKDGAILLSNMVDKALLQLLKRHCSC
jgi:hypothetical protein